MTWHFPALDALGDAVGVVAVTGAETGDLDSGTLRLCHLNEEGARLFGAALAAEPGPELGGALGERDRIVAAARTGRAQSWVTHVAGSWFELRAAALPDRTQVAESELTRCVLVVARELGSVGTAFSRTGDGDGSTGVPLLLQISRRLGAAVSEAQVAEAFFDLVCPALGAGPGALALTQPDGGITVLRRPRGESLQRRSASGPQDRALLSVIRQGRQRLDDVDGTTATLTVPLRPGELTVGAMSLLLDGAPQRNNQPARRPGPTGDHPALGQARQEFIDTVAAMVAQAVHRARLFDAQLEASLALQHALLPPTLPRLDRIELAARYRAGSGHEVGGDWYDVIPLASGWVAFVIGDVQGHDLPAAALMGQIRSVMRAYLLDELPPTTVLSSANAFLHSLGADRLVTVCVALVHPRSRLITVASAGHASPLLLTPGRPGTLLEIQPGPPLGAVEEVIWRERTALLPKGAALVMYTDGLIERRDRAYEVGEQHLLDLARVLPDVSAERLADALLAIAGVAPSGSSAHPPLLANEDDTAMLLLRWRPAEPADALGAGHVRTLPVTSASAVIARWYVEDLLKSWGVAEDVRENAVLLTDELVANAVRHAHRVIRLDISAPDDHVLVEVFDDSHREPQLISANPSQTSGRGLQLVQALSTAWGVRVSQGDLGKTIWFTLAKDS